MEIDLISLTLYCFFFLLLAITGINGRAKWKQRGMITGFVIALFAEMWGFPLSIFVITSMAGSNNLPYQFDNLMYFFTQPHGTNDVPFYNPPIAWIVEYTLARGIALLALFPIIYGWVYLKRNLKNGLVTEGPYAYSRNPQYVGFILFVIGMTMYWPTLITIPMGVALCLAYFWLARREERELAKTFGDTYSEYARHAPRFFGSNTYKIFWLPKDLTLSESFVEAALFIPFVLWFAEALATSLVGDVVVRNFWFPIAYVLPVHIGIVVAVVLFVVAGLVSVFTRYSKTKT